MNELAFIVALLAANPGTTAPKADDFRIVDGKLYNRSRSQLWIGLNGEFVRKLPQGALCQEVAIKSVKTPPRVNPAGVTVAPSATLTTFKERGKFFLLKNFRPSSPAITGQPIDCLALPVGVMQYRGDTIAVYDCGLPNVASNRVALATNAISKPKVSGPER